MPSAVILFDLDGVLIDSWDVARTALDMALADIGFAGKTPHAAFRERLGKPLPTILRELSLPTTAAAPFNRHAMAMTRDVAAFPGVAEALSALRDAGFRIGVVTGKPRARARAVLAATGLDAVVEALVTPDDAPGKPDPAACLLCSAALGAALPRCYVGDTGIDLETARAAGVPAILAAWGAQPEARALAWDAVAECPGEITPSLIVGLGCDAA